MYQGYDQAALDMQYDVGAHYRGLEAFREQHAAARAAANARARAASSARLDLPYGSHAREKIDFFAADKSGGAMLIYIHGGYWKQRDRSDFSFLAPGWLARGINYASVGYPLCPEVRLRDIVESCRRAVAHLAGEARSLGFDPGRIHVSGHSAGGHLSAMMMATDWTRYGLPSDLLRSGTAISGLYDLAPIALTKMNEVLRIDAAEIADLSPARLAPRHAGPLILTVGGRETAEFKRQTAELAASWSPKALPIRAVESADFYHFNVVDTLGQPGMPLFEAVRAVIES